MILPTLALSITSFAGLQRITRGGCTTPGLYSNRSRQRATRNRVIYVHALRRNPFNTPWFRVSQPVRLLPNSSLTGPV